MKSIVHDDTDSTIQDEIENSHDSECEFPGQDAGGEIIAQLKEKFHSTDERSERVKILKYDCLSKPSKRLYNVLITVFKKQNIFACECMSG